MSLQLLTRESRSTILALHVVAAVVSQLRCLMMCCRRGQQYDVVIVDQVSVVVPLIHLLTSAKVCIHTSSAASAWH